MERYGTSHFVSLSAARAYYRQMNCYTYLEEVVQDKLETGEIHIGKPEAREGWEPMVDTGEGRWFMVKL